MADNPIWERLPSDTEKSFEAFCIYRDMGSNRTLIAVAEKLQKSYTLIRRWDKEHGWQERVASYDKYLDSTNVDETLERQKLIKDNAFEDYLTLRKAIGKYKIDYEKVEFKGVAPYEVANLVELMKKADDYARRAVGLPDKITEQKQELTGKDGGAIETKTTLILKTGMDLDEL